MAVKAKSVKFGTQYRFTLEPYRGPSSKHVCPKCQKKKFVRYIDVTDGTYLGDMVGRCDSVTKCGYHNPPTADMLDGKSLVVSKNVVLRRFQEAGVSNLIDAKYVNKTMTFRDNFSQYLIKKFGYERTYEALLRYKIGESKFWDGATVFWQIDVDSDVRTGKIMLYDPDTCKRVKTPFPHINWIHVPMRNNDFGDNQDFHLRQCFFGEHLLDEFDGDVHIVESEKTAVACHIARPHLLWVATGGIQNLTAGRLITLSERKLIFYPDKGEAAKVWGNKLATFEGLNYEINTAINDIPTLKEGDDWADYILG